MKELHIYSFGHALVDEEYSVSEDFLTSQNIGKSHRTLIDYQYCLELRRCALIAGQLDLQSSGGSAANTLATASLMGAHCHFSCLLGNDSEGQFYLNELAATRISTDPTPLHSDGHTGVCLVLRTPDAARTMNTYVGITDDIGPEHLNLPALKQAKWLYLEGHLLISESGFQAAISARDEARKNGIRIAVNFCDPAVVRLCRDRLAILLDKPVDLLFCNEEEALIWSKQGNIHIAMEHLYLLARNWVLTLGEKGAILFDQYKRHTISAHPVPAISTLGAGDTFAGAFMYGLVTGYSYEKSGQLASLTSAYLVKQSGPRLSESLLQEIRADFESNNPLN
jgi:sugar/nucleoside kinase (ribokinase family)